MKKRILACLLALVMLIGVLPVMALAENNVVTPEGFAEAVKKAKDGDTITLGKGTYTLYGKDGIAGGKSLTFVGAGKDETIWNIGTGEKDVGQGNADFSLRGAKTVTFRNMTLKAGIINGNGDQVARDYMGFAHTDVTVVEDCVIDGRTCYWGYISSDFVNTEFDSPDGYALWYYTGKSMTFDSCVFNVNADGKTINVYRESNDSYTATAENEKYGSAENPIVLNLKDCRFYAENPNKETKQVLNIKEYCNSNRFYYVVNFSGNTVVNGISVNKKTCSRLFQVQGVADGYNCNEKENALGTGKEGLTTVNIEGKTVWANGKMVEHNVDIPGGSYDDGVAEGTANKYTDGYKDNAFTVTETGWVQQPDGSYKWMVTRVCKHCGYKETVEETKRDDVDDITAILLPALQANTDDHYSYLIGYSDGTVRPNGKITRAEVATIFFRLLDDDTRAKYWSSKNDFSDVSADKWYNNAVSTLSNMGVIGGYADGTFRPDAPISRAEFAKIAVSFTQNNGSAVYNYFTDVKTTDWFAPYVTAAKDAGLIEGYSDGSFKPESKITRAEACAIVNRTLGRKPSKAHMKISDRIDWPDVQTTDWFYEAIMEATNSHTCTMGDRVETWTGKLPQRDWAALETGWANAYTGNGGEVR